MTDQFTADRQRIKAQDKASEVFEFIQGESPEDAAAYWERLHKLISTMIPANSVLYAKRDFMTENEAKAFEKTVLNFGIHAGKIVQDVPPEYWISLTESAFQKRLLRYVKSERFRRLLSEPPDEEEIEE